MVDSGIGGLLKIKVYDGKTRTRKKNRLLIAVLLQCEAEYGHLECGLFVRLLLRSGLWRESSIYFSQCNRSRYKMESTKMKLATNKVRAANDGNSSRLLNLPEEEDIDF